MIICSSTKTQEYNFSCHICIEMLKVHQPKIPQNGFEIIWKQVLNLNIKNGLIYNNSAFESFTISTNFYQYYGGNMDESLLIAFYFTAIYSF